MTTRLTALLAVAIVLGAPAAARRDDQGKPKRMCGRVFNVGCRNGMAPLTILVRGDNDRILQLAVPSAALEGSAPRIERRYLGCMVCVDAPAAKDNKIALESLSDVEITAEPAVPIPSLPPDVYELCDQGIKPPVVQKSLQASYPDDALKQRIQGLVGMRAVVGTDGTVTDVVIVEPLAPALDRASVAAMRAWRFAPGTKDGVPVAVAVYLEMSFYLR